MNGDASNPSVPDSMRYWCFISYRHADNKEEGRQWATWLHHAIETYEVPGDLAGTTNERGDVIPQRIFPVFRDEEELPADADLSSPIYRALDTSRMLIVICSPRVVASTYVNDEIRYFKKLGGEDRVLAVMVEGEPNASRDAGKQSMGFRVEDECFPDALRQSFGPDGTMREVLTEPIAADFRLGQEQGWTSPEAYRQAMRRDDVLSAREIERRVEEYRQRSHLMLLKILAGILGVPLGRLTQRDKAYQLAKAQRRARLARRIAAGFAVLALAAIAAAIIALVQYRAAQVAAEHATHARHEAEKLVEFMVFDLRDKLQPIGRLDLLDDVNHKVDEYYRAFGEQKMDLGVQRQRAVAITNAGNVLGGQGKLADAIAKYQEALRLQKEIAAARPNDPQAHDDLFVSYKKLGDTLREQGDLDAALTNYRAAHAEAENLVKGSPDDAIRLSYLALSGESMGAVKSRTGDLKGALDDFQRALKIAQALSADQPEKTEPQFNASVLHERVGETLSALGDIDGARRNFEEERKICEALVKSDPRNAGWRRALSVSELKVGEVQIIKGDLAAGLTNFRAARETMSTLSAQDPSNVGWQREVLVLTNKITDALGISGDLEAALKNEREGVALAEKLAAFDSTNADSQRDLSISQNRLGDRLRLAGKAAEALEHYQSGLAIAEKLVARDPANDEWLSDLAVSQGKIGDAYRAQNEFRKSARTLSQGAPDKYQSVNGSACKRGTKASGGRRAPQDRRHATREKRILRRAGELSRRARCHAGARLRFSE